MRFLFPAHQVILFVFAFHILSYRVNRFPKQFERSLNTSNAEYGWIEKE